MLLSLGGESTPRALLCEITQRSVRRAWRENIFVLRIRVKVCPFSPCNSVRPFGGLSVDLLQGRGPQE
jgi:hypothetical protein